MYQQLRLEPYAVHTTFQYAGTAGKRHRLREAMLFFDQPSYYDSPGMFILWPYHDGTSLGQRFMTSCLKIMMCSSVQMPSDFMFEDHDVP